MVEYYLWRIASETRELELREEEMAVVALRLHVALAFNIRTDVHGF
jgi:hypothetical protein